MDSTLSTNNTLNTEEEVLTLGHIQINLTTGLYSLVSQRNNMNLYKKLSYKYLTLLKLLIDNLDSVVTQEEIMDKVWPGRLVTVSSITVAIHKLRVFIESTGLGDTVKIKNFSGLGYGMYIVK